MGGQRVATEQDEFITLVRSLRELGATRVRWNHFEAAFAAPAEAPTAEPERKRERISLSTSEMDELEELRAMRRRLDERGLEV